MVRHWSSNPNRDAVTRLRGLVGEKGYRLEKAPIRDHWFLINEKTGKPAVSDRGATAFKVANAVAFLSKAAPGRGRK
jgi:hypothetical protein